MLMLLYFYLKQLNGTFHFMLILATPVDKGSSFSPKVKLHVLSPSHGHYIAGGMNLRLAAEAIRIQQEQTPAQFHLTSRSSLLVPAWRLKWKEKPQY